MYQIGEVARLSGVTQRLLRHYGEIGLLEPSARSAAGYRLYTRADLERLQQILFYRTLEFPLQEILRLMNDPDFDRATALRQQRELLKARAGKLQQLLCLIDTCISETETSEEQSTMSEQSMFEVFPALEPEYLEEAQQRWGESEAWKQSAERSKRYTKQDWERMKCEMEQVNASLEAVFSRGCRPDSGEALAAVEAARLLIGRWHYECSRSFHVTLTAMTSSDPRFVKNIDVNCAGLAAFIHSAAKANLAREAGTAGQQDQSAG